jgi:DNA-binding transcriptional ArsR family regulator
MDKLAKFFSSRVKAEILRLLFGLQSQELHLRELARQSGLTAATVRQELTSLLDLGLVRSRRSGNRTYYRAEEAHPLYSDIRNIVLKTSGLADVLREALEKADVRAAFVFGSLATGSERAESDVDLMVIGSLTLRQLSELLQGVDARVGREINPHVLTPREFAARKREKQHFLTTVLRAPKLFVIGNEDVLAEVA